MTNKYYSSRHLHVQAAAKATSTLERKFGRAGLAFVAIALVIGVLRLLGL